jgi:EpsI family protein
MIKLIVALGFLALNVYTYHFMARKAVIPPRDTFVSFPLEIEKWRCARNQPLEPEVKANLGATDTLICDYHAGADLRLVGVYVGYHATQVREEGGGSWENSIHPPSHCLPGSGWDIIESATVPLQFEGVPDPRAHAKRLVIAKGEARQLVYYWYQMQGRFIAEDWQKILYVGWDRATRGRTDGALVRFTIPLSASDDAAEAAERAFRDLAPRILGLLPRYVPV